MGWVRIDTFAFGAWALLLGVSQAGCGLAFNNPSVHSRSAFSLNWSDPTVPISGYLSDWEGVIAQGTTGAVSFSSIGGLPGGGGKWCGGILAPNGKIYGIPSASSDVLVIDPSLGTASAVTMGGVDSACGGVLASNGKIYSVPEWITGAPPDQGRLVEIDPMAGTATRVGVALPTTVGDTNYHGGVLAPNGDLYIIPAREPRVIRYDLDTFTATPIGTNYGTTGSRKMGRWRAGSQRQDLHGTLPAAREPDPRHRPGYRHHEHDHGHRRGPTWDG